MLYVSRTSGSDFISILSCCLGNLQFNSTSLMKAIIQVELELKLYRTHSKKKKKVSTFTAQLTENKRSLRSSTVHFYDCYVASSGVPVP